MQMALPQPERQRHQITLRCLEDFGRRDRDTETFQSDVMLLSRRVELDRGDAKVAQNLSAQTDFAPLRLATKRFIMSFSLIADRRTVPPHILTHADRPFTQVDDNAALGLSHLLHHAFKAIGWAKNVRDRVFRMQS